MQSHNTSRTRLRAAGQRLLGISLVVGIVIGGSLAPLAVGATDELSGGHPDVEILTSDEAFVLEDAQMRQQEAAQAELAALAVLTPDEAFAMEQEHIRQQEAAKAESAAVAELTPEEEYGRVMEEARQRTVVRECHAYDVVMDRHWVDTFPSCEFTAPDDLSVEIARQAAQERQASAIAEAYGSDGVYTLYDADAVFASNLPAETKSAVLGMIAPTVLLAVQNGHNGVFV